MQGSKQLLLLIGEHSYGSLIREVPGLRKVRGRRVQRALRRCLRLSADLAQRIARCIEHPGQLRHQLVAHRL